MRSCNDGIVYTLHTRCVPCSIYNIYCVFQTHSIIDTCNIIEIFRSRLYIIIIYMYKLDGIYIIRERRVLYSLYNCCASRARHSENSKWIFVVHQQRRGFLPSVRPQSAKWTDTEFVCVVFYIAPVVVELLLLTVCPSMCRAQKIRDGGRANVHRSLSVVEALSIKKKKEKQNSDKASTATTYSYIYIYNTQLIIDGMNLLSFIW